MSKLKMLFKLILVFVLIFGASFGVGASIHSFLLAEDQQETAEEVSKIPEGERTNILLLGVDARKGEKQTRSDTIILASIDPKLNKVALISIPRDTRVDIPGSWVDKINGANTVGGPKLVVKEVEEMMGEDIDYYVEMNFEGFKKIIDKIGGVNINVDQRMYKPTEDIDLKPGQQTLNGYDALAFVRYRDYALGDIARTEHQQIFLKALGKELLQAKNIVKLPSLIKAVKENIDTNLTTTDMLKMAAWAPGFSGDSIVAQTLPGYFLDKRDSNGVLLNSYWVADQDKTDGLLDKMLAGQTVAVVSETPAAYVNTPSSTVKPDSSTQTDTGSDDADINTGTDANTTDIDIEAIPEDEDTVPASGESDWEQVQWPDDGQNDADKV